MPLLYTDVLDILSGTMYIRREGANLLSLASNQIYIFGLLRLQNEKYIRDGSGATVLDTDDAGHITTLGRVDGALTTPEDSHEVVCSPSELVNVSQSGTLNEDTGYWSTNADDTLYLFLGRVLNFQEVNGTIVLDSVIIHYNTDHNDVYINIMDLRTIDVITGGLTGEVQDTDDYGNGSTGNENVEYEMSETLVTGKIYRMSLGIEATAGIMIVRAVTLKYHVV